MLKPLQITLVQCNRQINSTGISSDPFPSPTLDLLYFHNRIYQKIEYTGNKVSSGNNRMWNTAERFSADNTSNTKAYTVLWTQQ